MPELFEEKFDDSASEEDILETFEHWKKNSETYHNEMLKEQKIALEYYHGNQTDIQEVPLYLSDTVENRIFEAVETIVPIATANAHHFMVLPGSDDELSVQRSDSLQKVLVRKYETLNVQGKLEQSTRHMLTQKFGVLKWGWDTEKDDIGVWEIDPRLMLIPRVRTSPEDLPYTIEIQGYTRSEFEEEFPDIKYEDLPTQGTKVETTGRQGEEKEMQVFEVRTDEYEAWIVPGKVLKHGPNSYFDFAGETVKELKLSKKTGKVVSKEVLKFFNHLDRPQKPYVFFSTFNLSDGPVASKSLVDIGIPIQDSINAQKRAIINNLKQMGNGQVYVDSDAMTQEQADDMTNEPGLVIRGKGLASEGKIKREPGTPLPNAHFANLQHSEAVFDNIMGVHSSTRGQAQANTLGQDIISRQQDFTRIDMITRELNRGVARLANGLVQLMKMFYTETHVIKLLGEEGAVEFVRLNRDDIDDHIEIYVKGDIALPMDEVSKRTEAVQLWQLGATDPVTLYERLKFPNPEKAAQRLLAWKQGQLDAETQAKIQAAEAGAQAKAAGSPGEETSPGQDVQQRRVETPQNVIQRSTENLGGTAPTNQVQ